MSLQCISQQFSPTNIPNSAVFQAGGLVVVLVEVFRKNFLASVVPVIVNTVLNAHQVVVDIVAFVSRGDFPRSRLGEKQRGKILASWVTRKMRTIAQFGIKDPDAVEQHTPDPLGPRSRGASLRNGGSSLKHVESSSGLVHVRESVNSQYVPLPPGVVEMPAARDDSSILESPPAEATMDDPREHAAPSSEIPTLYSPLEDTAGHFLDDGDYDFGRGAVHTDDEAPQPRYESKPFISLPSVDGRGEVFHDEERRPSTQGGLRIANRTSLDDDDDDDWSQQAVMHHNLAGSPGHGRFGR